MLRRMQMKMLLLCSLVACGGKAAPQAGGMTSASDKWVEGSAGRLRVSDGGSGEPAIVLVHGLAGGREVWAGQVEHLRRSHRVVAYDQRGHGESEPAKDGVYSMEAMADDVERVRTELALGKVVLVGHSMSGAVLSTYAGRHPDAVAGLVFLDAIGDFSAFPAEEVKPYAEQSAKATDEAARRAQYAEELQPARPETREVVNAGLDRVDGKAFTELSAAMFALRDARQRIAPYQGPMIAIEAQGNELPFVASKVFGIERVEIAGVSHWLHLDDPAAVNAALDRFLATVH